MHIGANNPLYTYHIRDNNSTMILETTLAEKDLGVYIDPLLCFKDHINNTIKKSKSMVGLLNRTITYKSAEIMVPLYKTLIRPILEYANSVWCPYLRKDIDSIENIQKHFTRNIIGMASLDYSDRLKVLGIPSLEFRRVRGDLIEMFKICHELYDPVSTKPLINFVNVENPTRKNHCFKLMKLRLNYDFCKYFFSNRVINLWNSLDSETANATSLNSFKNKVDKLLKDYMFCTNLNIYY